MKISFKAVVAAAAGVALATGLGMGAAAAAASASVRPATVTVNAPTRHTVALEPCGLNVCWMDLSSRFQITTGPSGWTHGTHWSVSVSYTHLRAHETRHDLVCRLLLEKKKKRK